MREIRWHARAGQGAKTASQLYATALLHEGKSVQAFPEGCELCSVVCPVDAIAMVEDDVD
jgi:pyruvate ferredoxin oxidoreductase gamma subunit